MDVLTLARILLRRWYVVLPILLLTGVGLYLVSLRPGPTHTTQGSMLLADPELQTPDEAEGSTIAAADVAAPSVLAEVMADAEIAERIVDAGGSEDYSVTVAGEDGLLRVMGAADDEGAAIDTVDVVLDELEAEAERRQDDAGIDEDERIAVETLSRPASAVQTEGPDGEVRHEAVGSARASGRFGAENPYASSEFAFAVLDELVSSEQGRADLAEAGATAEFEMDVDASIMSVRVNGVTPESVMRTYQVLTDELTSELERRQVEIGITSAERTRLQPLTEPLGVSTERSDLLRPLVTLSGLGVVAAIGLALLFDNLMTALAARRARPDFEHRSGARLGTADGAPPSGANGNGGGPPEFVPPTLRDLSRETRQGPSAREDLPMSGSGSHRAE